MVYRACFRTLVNRHDAEDASQAVFMTLIKKSEKLCREGSLACWLYKAARQTAIFMARTRARRGRVELAASEVMGGLSHSQVNEKDQELVLGFLDKELDALSDGQREAVILRYLDGMNEKDAAAIAGCSYNAFRSRLGDGISNLRKRLVRRGCTFGVPALIGVLVADAQAAVPQTLIPSLLAVPKLYAAGATSGAASANITYIMEGTLKTMFIAKIKMVGAVTVMVLLVGSVGVFAAKEFPKKTNVVANEELVVAETPVTQAQDEITPEKSKKNGTGITVQKQKTNGSLVPAAAGAGCGVGITVQKQKTNGSSQDSEEPVTEDLEKKLNSMKADDFEKKLNSINIEHLEFKDVPLKDVVKTIKAEALAADPEKKGVDIILLGVQGDKRINLSVDNVSLLHLIKNLCAISNLQYNLGANAAYIMPGDPKRKESGE